MSALLRIFSVPIGTPTTRGDSVVLASANSVLRLALAPREPVPPTAVAVAGHGHDRRADDENAAYIWVRPSSRRRSPPRSAVSRTARLLLCKPLYHPAGCPQVRTRSMVYRRSEMRTPRFRMQMSILMGIGTTNLLQLLRLLLPHGSFPRTGTSHNGARLKQRTTVFYSTPGDETHFLKDLQLTVPRMPTVHRG